MSTTNRDPVALVVIHTQTTAIVVYQPPVDTQRCPCCRKSYPWDAYRYIGVQRIPGEPGIELRLCPVCTSTTARELPEETAEEASAA